MTQYELQPGQTGVISDILTMLDTMTDRLGSTGSDNELLRSLGMIGTAAALAAVMVARNKGGVSPDIAGIIKTLSR